MPLTHSLPLGRRMFIGASASLLATRGLAAEPGGNAIKLLGPEATFGWYALDLGSDKSVSHNPDMRFPLCSSFKWLLAAAVLWRVDTGVERLNRPVGIEPQDVVFNSPTIEEALQTAGGKPTALSVGRLCEATVTLSDSAAANLLLRTLGGPAGLTAWLRTQGDPVSRLDRTELTLNRVPPGDERDTTTPAVMVANMTRLLYGNALSFYSQDLLRGWMLAAKPGATGMPAGLRPGWRIGHKTGTWQVDPGHGVAERATSGDVAFLIPTFGAPILIAAYTAGSARPQADVDRWFAELVTDVSGPGGLPGS